MIDITDANFKNEVLMSEQIVLVDCYAEWCSPCKAIKPMLIELAEQNEGRVKLGLLDVEHNPVLTEQLRVSSIPKVVIYKAGEKITELLGVRPMADYQDVISGLL